MNKSIAGISDDKNAMRNISTLEEYKSIIKENKAKFPKQDRNSIMLAGAMEPYILEGRVFAQELENGLYILIDEGGFYNLHYYLKKDTAFPSVQFDKPVIFDETGQNGNNLEYLRDLKDRIADAGFKEFRKTYQLAAEFAPEDKTLEDLLQKSRDRMNSQGLSLTREITEEQVGSVISLWDDQLGFGDVFRDHYDFYGKDSYALFCAIDDSTGAIAGICLHEITGRNTSLIWHTVVNPEYKHKGIGTALNYYSMYELLKTGINKYFTWIHTDNVISLDMCFKVGFRKNGRECTQFIADFNTNAEG